MAEAIAYDRKKILAVCALLEGEYGVNGLFVGVPAIIGAGGIEKIIEVDLTAGREGRARTTRSTRSARPAPKSTR